MSLLDASSSPSASLLSSPSLPSSSLPSSPLNVEALSVSSSHDGLSVGPLGGAAQADTVSTESTVSEPDVIIPEALSAWLSFNRETGLLSGTPPQDVIDELRFTFLAQDGDESLSSVGRASIGEAADSETFFYTYDAANRVQVDGGVLNEEGQLELGTQGQWNAPHNLSQV
jgi:hypothetical protein